MTGMTPQSGAGCYATPQGNVEPGGEQVYGYRKIMSLMHGLEPGDVSAAGDAFKNLSGKLESLRSVLQSAGDQLAGNESWQGSAAGSAMRHFQQLHDQTAQLSAQSQTAGATLHWLGDDVMPHYKSIPNPTVASGAEQGFGTALHIAASGITGSSGSVNGTAAADAKAQDYLKTFNGHLATANVAMPVNLARPQIGSGNYHALPGNNSGSGSGSGSGAGSGSTSGYTGVPGPNTPGGAGVPSYVSPSSANPFSSSKLPHGGAGPSASLQGYAPPTIGSTASPFGSGASNATTGGGSANPFSRMTIVPGGAPGYRGRGPGPGEENLTPHEDNTVPRNLKPEPGPTDDPAGAGSTESAGAAGAETGEDAGSRGMPMGSGGSGGSQDQERQRQAWMNEDKTIWGAPDEEIGSVIG